MEIRNVYRHVTSILPSKAQALSAAIELAEKDGERGDAPEVLVRREDDRFITEWVYGDDLHPDDAARPATAIACMIGMPRKLSLAPWRTFSSAV